MGYIEKVCADKINSYIPANCTFVCFSSFEDRCLSLLKEIDSKKINEAFVFRNIEKLMDTNNEKNTQIITDSISNASVIKINLSSSINLADSIFDLVKKLHSKEAKDLVVDITTFTHEALLILIKNLFLYKKSFKTIRFIYNSASAYSPWLSKGCKEVRNVIGYPGIFNPALKYHLVILTGFEYERATRLVELMEPDILSVGIGLDPTSNDHLCTMQNSEAKFKSWLSNLPSLSSNTFSFSCSHIEETIRCLKKFALSENEENLIFVPLNTKLSTISVALVALQNKQIQVTYPIPEIYNLEYSKVGESFTIINLLEMADFSGG